ncbi:hypothetical protein [Solimonas marina]|nr:hypothetical protein [Solimonas marina]
MNFEPFDAVVVGITSCSLLALLGMIVQDAVRTRRRRRAGAATR